MLVSMDDGGAKATDDCMSRGPVSAHREQGILAVNGMNQIGVAAGQDLLQLAADVCSQMPEVRFGGQAVHGGDRGDVEGRGRWRSACR
jgi:hypothetical protein